MSFTLYFRSLGSRGEWKRDMCKDDLMQILAELNEYSFANFEMKICPTGRLEVIAWDSKENTHDLQGT